MTTRSPKFITNQKLWEMAGTIIDGLKNANELDISELPWAELQSDWHDWLEEELFEEDDVINDLGSKL